MASLAAWLQALPPWQFWGGIAVAGAMALIALGLGVRRLHLARLIEDTPTARIQSAPQGFVELEGRAVMLDGAPVVAPLSGKYCVWYRYRVEEWGRRIGRQGSWRLVEAGESSAIFGLEDDSGRCLVDPAGAWVETWREEVWRSDERVPPGHHDPLGRYRYLEHRIEAGDPLYTLGWFRTLRGEGDGGLQAEVATLLRRWKADRHGLLQRFDVNRDGEIDLREWQLVRRQAERTVLQRRMRRPAPGAVDVLQRPPRRHLPFVLATFPQARLAGRYRWWGWGGLSVFVLLAGLIAWCLQQRLG